MGCLGMIQPLFLMMTPELNPLGKKIHKLSADEVQNFPFMVLSINLTRIAFDALKRGFLNRSLNGTGFFFAWSR